MNDSTMAYDLFNAKLHEFVKDLGAAFPDVEDFKLFRNALTLAINFAPTKPQKMFNKFVVCHYDTQIRARDEQFFLAHDFSHLLTDDDFDIVERIRSVWGRMDEVNRNVVWKYLQVLLLLDQKCRAKST